ncbi:MAG: cytochrome c oxidase accessory protein FixG [Cellvibrionaceae bacterium]|jgi:cytochrome c oxidase accessory protein FixG
MYLAWLLIISAFLLFAVTVLWGRVWCGFTCPQTVWTLMFIWAETLFEGDRNQRIKLDNNDWTTEKALRRSSKYTLWLIIAFITGATFISYFYPIRELLLGFLPRLNDNAMLVWDGSASATLWTLFFTFMTFMNAGFLREQVCIYMCPYARFQSVMYDEDTLAVHYDEARGEQRGSRKIGENYEAKGMGDCVDCSWCVQVCPVDIDIRDGLQSECINCGLCVDACNAVMDTMNYSRGLIRYTSENQLKNGKTTFLRPRVFGYFALVVVMVTVFSVSLAYRNPVRIDIDRDRGVRMYKLQGDKVQNVYSVKINNMHTEPHEFSLRVDGPGDFTIVRYRSLPIEPNEIFTVPVRVEVDRSDLQQIKTAITFTLTAKDDTSIVAKEATTFIGPEPKNPTNSIQAQ